MFNMGRRNVKRRPLGTIIAALIFLNCFTIVFFAVKLKEAGNTAQNETVATIGTTTITRQDWLNELVDRYGKDILTDMINQKVVKSMADKYNIKVSNQDVEREYRILQTTNNSDSANKPSDEKKWKDEIRSNLLLEELLTKDVVIPEKELKNYYVKNKDQYNVPTAYHLSQIIVKTKAEANRVLKELAQGSSFSALAMELSLDDFSANQGGDIGYLTEGDDRYPDQYIQVAKALKAGEYSGPIQAVQGYTILKLDGKIEGKNYSYDEVKNQIRRDIALEQMKIPASAKAFWKEAEVQWVYGNTSGN